MSTRPTARSASSSTGSATGGSGFPEHDRAEVPALHLARSGDAVRIAEIAPPWIQVPPEGYGGIELVVDLLAYGFEARGHDVTLFAPEGSRSAAEVVSPLPAAGSDSIGDRWHEAYHAVSAYQHAEDFDLIHD